MGTLFVVGTPIGNIADITLRAIETLFSVQYIVSEQVGKTKQLLSLLQTRYPQLINNSNTPHYISCNEFEEIQQIPKIISILENGESVALVSEAGMPLISDPGYKLVSEAIKRNISVVSIPGVSAITTALSISGLPTDKFLFLGFLPKQKIKKENKFSDLKDVLINMEKNKFNATVIFFESPHRVVETMTSLQTVFGDIHIVVARELTKKFEEVKRGSIVQLLQQFQQTSPKGEITVLFSIKEA